MFVVVNRKQKVVRVEGLTTQEACWLGYHFALQNNALVKEEKWCVVCFDKIDAHFGREETYNLKSAWSANASKIATIIHNPPTTPVHDCPDCECPPEKCCK